MGVIGMSKIKFKDNIYSLGQLIDLRRLSPLYKEGEVADLDTGLVLDINQIDEWKATYVDELLSQSEKESTLKRKEKDKKIRLLETKFKENRITKSELFELIKEKTFEQRKGLEIEYENFYMVNAGKEKPKEINVTDYGRFFLMLDYMSYTNKIQHASNGRVIKEDELAKHLEFNTIKTFHNFISKLTKHRLLCKSGSGDKRFIHINPAFAKRKMKIDQTLYDLFKDDLKEFLSEYEIRYFELMDDEDDSVTPSTFQLLQSTGATPSSW